MSWHHRFLSLPIPAWLMLCGCVQPPPLADFPETVPQSTWLKPPEVVQLQDRGVLPTGRAGRAQGEHPVDIRASLSLLDANGLSFAVDLGPVTSLGWQVRMGWVPPVAVRPVEIAGLTFFELTPDELGTPARIQIDDLMYEPEVGGDAAALPQVPLLAPLLRLRRAAHPPGGAGREDRWPHDHGGHGPLRE